MLRLADASPPNAAQVLCLRFAWPTHLPQAQRRCSAHASPGQRISPKRSAGALPTLRLADAAPVLRLRSASSRFRQHRVMELILRADNAKDWIYKGEGAANIVLGYTGSFGCLLGKVLRVKKVPRGQVSSKNGSFLSRHEILLWGGIVELAESTSNEIVGKAFVMNVMGPLLDHKHVDGGILVIVTTEFLKCIANNVLCLRPASRVDASEVDTLCDHALLLSDHSVILKKSVPGSLDEEVCFAIELKPKCGFLPQSEFIAKRNAIKKHVTRFKMHQILKLHQRQISQLSEYNPLDLFSGNKQKISRAILALFTTPQNNFRIFLNGSLIFGGLGGSMDNVAHGFQNTNGEIENIKTIGGLHFASIVEFIAEAIFSSSILARLLNAQKLDVFDIEGAIHAYYNILSQPCLACRNSVDADLLDRYSFLHSLSLEESFELVRNCLISATAKDCSLMISFRPMKESDATELSVLHLKESNQSFEYKVNFVDLDMKPLHKMDHYYKLDQKIVSFYTEYERNEISSSNSANA